MVGCCEKQLNNFWQKLHYFRNAQSTPDSDLAAAFQRRFHISVDENDPNNAAHSNQVRTTLIWLFFLKNCGTG
jgi:hypothetical protein